MGEMGEHNLRYVCFVFLFVIVFLGFYGAYIIPKLLIKVPGPIQYFLDDFWNFEKMSKSGPADLLTITKMP